jgi:hypothetical protein
MVNTLTPRLKLTVDPDGSSPVGVNLPNWSRVDQATGFMYTVAGVDLPVAQLYDGALVAEKDTGISWICKDNGAGGFNKQYINYPFTFVGTNQGSFGSQGGYWGFSTFYPTYSVNASQAVNLPALGGGMTISVKGLYSIVIHVSWGANGNGMREMLPRVNGVLCYDACERAAANPQNVIAAGTQHTVMLNRVLNVGTLIDVYMGQDSGVGLSTYMSGYITLVRPLP